jgi:Mn-dependent DtxR family transcriptional regulator
MATTELHSRKEIADRLGLDPTTVSRNLRKLEKESMVTHDQKTQQFSHVACDLDAVAEDLGVKGSRERQREYHRSERQNTDAPVERNERGGITLTARGRKKKQVSVRRSRLEQGDEE